jgi:hypothetical protein
MKKKPQSWHDKMVTVWVSPETLKIIQSERNPMERRKTADDVIQDMATAFRYCESHGIDWKSK